MDLLDQLKQAGAFGTGEPIPRTVEWEGNTYACHFIDLPGGRVQKLLQKDDADPHIIAESLCDAEGKPVLTLAQAQDLKLTLRVALAREAMDVFGFSTKARDEAKKD